ncbi:acyltransferase family protein [Qipengyuania sphaerica]|uniref:acyltransferase family protein n=1 Tax=Qipengyuania sphaerica TaxID=2867243 RepID=UPI001C88DBC4|nr:acyltransferase [Qipengyuania sphaerica]MBX7540350.1 acyltransferase [Qipengyuania sphaerica]
MGLVRFLLALAVLLAHMPTSTVKFIHGGLAVQAFFVVSGFYMALVLDRKYSDTKLFYSNRLLRLAPAYFAMMLIAGVALFGFGLTVTSSPGIFEAVFTNPLSAAVMLFENIFVIGQHWTYWFMIDEAGGLNFDPYGGMPTETSAVAFQALLVPQSWSLSLELMFYAIAPWLAKRHLRTLLAIAGASIGLRFLGHLLPVEFPLWQGRLFVTVLFMFLFGMLAYRAMPLVEKLPRAAHFAVLAALIALIVGMPQLGWSGDVQSWLIYFGVAVGTPFAFCATRQWKTDRWIGELSYPIYLTHLLVMAPVLIYEWPYPTWTTIVITLALSAAILQFIERPVDRWRQRRARGLVPANDAGSIEEMAPATP